MASRAPTVAYSTAAFRREREAEWQSFEALVDRLERGSLSRLSDDDLLALPRYYRATLSSLSLARATSLDVALVDYLEALSMRGYFLLYGVRESRAQRILHFFRSGWPKAVKSLWRETLVMALMLTLGAVVSWLLVSRDPAWFTALVGDMGQGRAPGASAQMLRDTIFNRPAAHGAEEADGLHVFAAFLFTHNSQISIGAYALGFAFGLPSLMLIFYQGIPLGGMLVVFHKAGLLYDFVGWLSIHGTTELFAAIISGAAGLRVGIAFAFPGPRSRLVAASEAGKDSGSAMLGVIIMLMIAGMLEGFARQLIQSTSLRYTVGGAMLVMWLCYFYLPRRATSGAAAS